MKRAIRAIAFSAALSATGCATAQFYSRTGQTYREVARQAIVCDEDEIAQVRAAGGVPIGTITARGLTVNATEDDVAAKAAKTAAAKGGTHILLTEKGVDEFSVTTPAEERVECAHGDSRVRCTKTYTDAQTRTVDKPTAKFIVFRVPAERWSELPPDLRPAS